MPSVVTQITADSLFQELTEKPAIGDLTAQQTRDNIPTFWVSSERLREVLSTLKGGVPRPYRVLYDLTGSYTLPFAIAGFFLFPAAFISFRIREGKYSARYSVQPLVAAGSGH